MAESTALTVITPEEQAYLDSLDTGKPNESNGPTNLVINMASKDADGNKRPIGAWHLKGTDKYFDGIAIFRPVRYANKLIKYVEGDNGNFDFVGESVYFTDFRDEILDSCGGVGFGRKFGKVLRELPEDEQEINRKLAGTYCDIFGFVVFGEDDPQPCMLRTRGGKLKVMLDAFNAVPKDKRYSQYNYKLEAYQEMDDKTKKVKDYWSIKATPDLSQILPISPILQFDSSVLEYIRDTNHNVMEEHKKARAKLEEGSTSAGATARVINAEVLPKAGATFNDELPF